jgi:hypothetical protein
MGVDLTKNFYLSYTYSLASTLQQNYMAAASSQPRRSPWQEGPEPSGRGASPPAPDPGGSCGGSPVVDWDSMFTGPPLA